jgi:hypothetical protein
VQRSVRRLRRGARRVEQRHVHGRERRRLAVLLALPLHGQHRCLSDVLHDERAVRDR